MANLLKHHSDADVLRSVIEDAVAVVEALEKKAPEDVRVPLFYTGYLNELNRRVREDGIAAHPLFIPFAREMSGLQDWAADDVFEVSKAIHKLTPPVKLEAEFGAVSGRIKGAKPPENMYRAMAEALKPVELPVQVMSPVKLSKRGAGPGAGK